MFFYVLFSLIDTTYFQKQSFIGVLQNRGFKKFRKFQRKSLRMDPFLIKLDLQVCKLTKKGHYHMNFPVNVMQFFRTAFLKGTFRQQLIYFVSYTDDDILYDVSIYTINDVTPNLPKISKRIFTWFAHTAQKMKFSIKDFISKCEQIRKLFITHCTKKLYYSLKISPVNVTESAGNCGFGHIY